MNRNNDQTQGPRDGSPQRMTKEQRKEEFTRFKDLQPSRILSATEQLQLRYYMSEPEALKTLLEFEEEEEANKAKQPTVLGATGSNAKQKAYCWKEEFMEGPLSFIFKKTIANGYLWATVLVSSCSVGAIKTYADAERTISDFPGTTWQAFKDIASATYNLLGLGHIQENPAVAPYGAAAVVAASTFLGRTPRAKASRLSLASAFLAGPIVVQDAYANAAEKTTEILTGLSAYSYALSGAALAIFVFSRFLPDHIYPKKKKTESKAAETGMQGQEKKESWAGAAISSALTSLRRGIYGGIGAVLAAAAKPFSMLGSWISSIRKKETQPPLASTQTMPIDMMPNPIAGGAIPWGSAASEVQEQAQETSEEDEASFGEPVAREPLPETEEMPAVSPGIWGEGITEEIVE